MRSKLLREKNGPNLAVSAAAILALAAAGTIVTAPAAHGADPLFGPNVTIFDENWSVDAINSALQAASHEGEFSLKRHQFFFAPGTYGVNNNADNPMAATNIINSELGYYQSVSGLGASPDDVLINGAIHVEPERVCEANPWDCQQPGSLTKFWRSMSNLAFNPIQQPVGVDATRPFPSGITAPHQMRFAVSQAAPLRRIHIKGDLTVFGRVGEYASGGYLADSKVDGQIVTGSQQQWFTRNSEVGTWEGGVWNNVFSGVQNAPATDFGQPRAGGVGVTTNVDKTPVSREIPFLYKDGNDFKVFVPKAHTNSTGANWSTDASAGQSLPIGDFYIAKAGDTAASINAALASGKNLLLTPEVYYLNAPIKVTRANTVVLGLGYASLVPNNGTAAIEIADVPGVKLAGITVDAHTKNSDVLVQVGPRGATAAEVANPTTLSDVFIRVGGPWAGNATTSIEVNTPNTLLDHIWAWRADHGDGVDWHTNVGDHGVVVNADNVTATGLFVEHYGKNQVIWNGNNGRTIFYQSELPYDPPTQADYMDGTRLGYSSYRVADTVTSHLAQGMGVYSFFDDTRNNGNHVYAESGVQAPQNANVRFESLTSVFLNGTGGINHVINGTGAQVKGGSPATMTAQVVSYPGVDSSAPTVSITADPAAPGPNGFYTKKVTLTVTASDDFLPAPRVEYRFLPAGNVSTESAVRVESVALAAAVPTEDDAQDEVAAEDDAEWIRADGPIVLGDGEHSVEVRAVDAAGNVSASASWSGKVRVAVDAETPEPGNPSATPTPVAPGDGGATTPGVIAAPGAQPGGGLPQTGAAGQAGAVIALLLMAAGIALGAVRRARAQRG